MNEWVPGQPLADADLEIPVDDILALFTGAADAVDFLHSAGVAHRDVHPRNLIVADDGRLVVIDFDMALTAVGATITRAVVGTQFTADLPDAASADPILADVVAFARCLVHSLAGDGDGALDHDHAVEKAVVGIKPHLADPDRFVDLLRAGLAGTAPKCSRWMNELRAATTTPPGLRAVLGRRARGVSRAAQRAGSRPRLLRSALAIIVVSLVLVGSLFFRQRSEAARRSAAATSRALAAASGDWAERDAVYSAMLALSAYEAKPTAEATTALFRPYLETQGATSLLSSPQAGLSDVQVSRDGRVVAGATTGQTFSVWTRAPGQETQRISAPTLRQRVTSMALSPDGAAVWLVDDGWLVRFDVSDGKLRRMTEVGGAAELAVSADGTTVAAVISSVDDRRAVIWSVRDGRLEPERLLPTAGTLMELTVGPGGSLVAQLSDRDAAGQTVKRLEVWGPGDRVRPSVVVDAAGGIVVTPAGDVAVTCTQTGSQTSRLAAVRLTDGAELGHAEPELGCLKYAVDPTGLKVVQKTADASAVVLELGTGEVVSRVRAPRLDDVTSRVLPLLAGSGDDLHLVVWNESAIALLAVPPSNTIVPGMPYNLVSPHGDFIVGTVSDGSELMTYPVAGTTPLATAARPAPYWPSGPRDLTCDLGCTRVADRVSSDRVAVRRLPDLELVREVTTPPVRPSHLRSEEAQRSHDLFFVAGRLVTVVGHQVDVWDVTSGEPVARLDLVALGHAASNQIVHLDHASKPDRLGLVVEGRPDVHVLDVASGREVATVRVGVDVQAAHFQWSSSLVVIVRTGGAVEAWDVRKGRPVFGPLAADKEFGRRIGLLNAPGVFVVADPGRYRVWKAGSAVPRLDVRFQELYRITSVSGDGRTVLYRGSQEYIGALSLDPGVWRRHVCSVIGHRGFADHKRADLPSSTPDDPLCP